MNALINETSPYLLQHAHNPVNWYPWGEEALRKARDENKLMLISIGYSSCHWCHVMEHESFEDDQVAQVMNEHFVCIKVDREERPDIDQVYMNAVQLMNGQGGWPLNCFTLPDQRPIYGGTYFRKEDWLNILQQLAAVYRQKPDEVKEFAAKLTEGIRKSELVSLETGNTVFTSDFLKEVYENWRRSFDYSEGGYARAPKFPLPNNFEFLLRYAHFFNDDSAHAIVHITLEKMAFGGIYDQLGGGFARYSVDDHWKVPHFEKMLYDNAQLVSLYSEAYQVTGNALYKQVVNETIEFLQREMLSSEFGFYSALDADSEGEEGKFYVWAKSELESILGEDEKIFSACYNCTLEGNWEHGRNILLRKKDEEALAAELNLAPEELRSKISLCKKKLMMERTKRLRLGLDDKLLAAWNGLMLKGVVSAYKAFGDESFLALALKNAAFIKRCLMDEAGILKRNYKNDKATINGFLDDYAFVIEAFIELYQVTFDEHWLNTAKYLMDKVIRHFYDEQSGMFFYTSDVDEKLIARKHEVSDNVIPASNSSIANSLIKLGFYFDELKYNELATQMLNAIYPKIKTYPSAYSNWLTAMLHHVFPPYEVAITGSNALVKLAELNKKFIPNKLVIGGNTAGNLALLQDKNFEADAMIYVCVNKSCRLPVYSVEEAVKQMSG